MRPGPPAVDAALELLALAEQVVADVARADRAAAERTLGAVPELSRRLARLLRTENGP